MRLGDRAVRLAANFTQRIAALGVFGMLGIAVLTTVDVVVLRYILNAPIPGSNELLSTVFAVAIAAVLASGIAQGASLEIDLLETKLPKGTVNALRAIGSAVQLLVLVGIVIVTIPYARDAQNAARQTTVLQLPVAPFLWAIVVCLAACIPAQLAVSLRAVARALPSPSASVGQLLSVFAALILAILIIGALAYELTIIYAAFLSRHIILVSLILFGVLWILILAFIPLSAAMVLCGLFGSAAVLGFERGFAVVSSETMDLITNTDLAVIPLFLLMGGFATVGGLAADIYRLGNALLGWARGGLAMATIAGSAGFGAFTGSSLATVATIGQAAIPEMKKRGYSTELTVGSVAAGGTLGQLVPPSTAIVLYALLTESSIGSLYIAVLLPALITTVFYILTVRVVAWWRPQAAPFGQPFSLRLLLELLRGALAVMFMFLVIIGGIYTGIFTVTEAAAVGAVFTFIVALVRGKLSGGALWGIAAETTRSTSMIYFIMIGAQILSFSIGISGLSEALTSGIAALALPAVAVVAMLVVAYILLGMILNSFAVMLITAAMSAGIVQSLGYDPLWWGIMMVALVEIGVVTPPFGLNLFGIKALVPDAPLSSIYRGVVPFVIADTIKIALLIAFPTLVLLLPKLAAH